MDKFSKFFPYALGVVIAGVVYVLPEVKPIACGGAALLPFLAV